MDIDSARVWWVKDSNKGHIALIKDMDQEASKKGSNMENFTRNEQFFLFLYKKIEKATTALYYVTELLSDREPLKWSLRDRCVSLLGNVLPLKDKLLTSQARELIIPAISEVVSLLDLASSASVISHMNAAVIRDGLLSVAKALDDEMAKRDLDAYISPKLFDLPSDFVESENLLSKAIRGSSRSRYKGHHRIKDKASNKRVDLEDVVKDTSASIKDISKASAHKDRKQVIARLVQSRGEATISDIAKEIKEYSEKTIQRDLGSLMEEGIIGRKGERRWTKYYTL